MKKRILSLFLALAMCLSLLPTAAFAAEDTTEQEMEQVEPVGPVEEEQEPQPTEGGGTADETGETDEAVQAAQALIDALPENVTAENAAALEAQLAALDEALAALSEEQYAQLDMTRYEALCEAMNELTAEQENGHSHPICGATHTNIGDHEGDCADVTWTAWDGVNEITYDSETKTAYVYLTGNAERDSTLTVAKGCTLYLCLNGYSITKTTQDRDDFDGVIMINDGGTLSLCDCNGSSAGNGKITHAKDKIGRGVRVGDGTSGNGIPTFNMFGGEISGNHAGETTDKQKQDGAGVHMQGGNFNMYGGKITDNYVDVAHNYGGGGVCMSGGSFTMYDGEISGNTSAKYGGGVAVTYSASFVMQGGTISGNKAATDGGGVYIYNGTFTLSDKAIITGNTATSGNGGGVYYRGYSSSHSMTVSGSAKIEKNNAANGGGIYVEDVGSGKANLTGGNISENNAGSNGGGIYVSAGDLNLSGNATITQNTATTKGGGVYYKGGSAKMFVSGNVQIIENKDTDGKANNVYVPTATGSTPPTHSFMIGQGGLDKNARIGVRVDDSLLQLGKCTLIAQNANNGCKEGNITSDQGTPYSIKVENNSQWTNAGTQVVNLYYGLPHIHPICGASHTDIGDHTVECANVTWTAWNGVDKITYDENNTARVYLTGNAERTSALEIANGYTLYLCLGGHSLTKNKTGSSVIKVGDNATLSLCDCSDAQSGKLTHGTTASGSKYEGHGVSLGYHSTFNMYGGSITGNRASTGGGVEIATEYSYAKFNMYGGSIANNAATNGDGGGGVHNLFGTFTMYGGSITGNSADTRGGGGGVYLARTGAFIMKGGSITGNTAKTGGGVYTNVNLNTGLTVSGKVTITGNKNASDNDENVYLASGKYIVISDSGLNADASIGVTSADTIATGGYVTVATGANKGYTEGNITSDKPAPYAIKIEGDNVNLYNGLHEHYICGDACTGVGHTCDEKVTFKAWSGASGKLPTESGYYYLTDNMTLTTEWEPPEGSNIVLCLNGKTITAKVGTADSASMTHNSIDLRNGVTVSMTDCVGTGKISRSTYYQRAVNVWGGTFNLYSGTITGFKADATSGGGVGIASNGIFNMYGGAITKNTSSYGGGGVHVGYFNSDAGTFNMYGGSITGNTSSGDGAGVRVSRNAKMTISGNVKITGNKKDYRTTTDNNVYLPRNKTITVTGALTGGANSIGVTTTDLLKDGCFIAIANGTDGYTLTDGDKNAFSEDDGSRFNSKLLKGNTLLLTRFVDIKMHEHPLCGADCSDGKLHSDELWQPLEYDSSSQNLYCGPAEASRSTDSRYAADNKTMVSYYSYTIPSGNYYLTEDLTLGGDGSSITGGALMIKGDVKLCLNGKTLSTTTTAYQVNVIKVDADSSLTLCDCSTAGSGKIESTNKVYTCVQPLGAQNTGKASGKFTMYGGTLTGAYYGVALNDANSVALYGGTITGNDVGVSATYPVTIGGTVNITGNTKNVRLLNKNQGAGIISIDPSLTQASRIGVSSEQTLSETTPSVQIATGAKGALDYTKIFTPDEADQGYVITKDDSGNLSLTKHTHVWKYKNSGTAAIKVTCGAPGCNLKSGFEVTYTLTAPTNLIYNGQGKAATITNNGIEIPTGVTMPTLPTISYKQGDAALSGTPTDAGTYTASITMGEGNAAVTASVEYTIGKADPKASDFSFTYLSDLAYNGQAKTLKVATRSGIVGMGEVTGIKCYDKDDHEVTPINVGTYTVKIDVAEGTNYTAASGLTADGWKFTIQTNNTVPTVELTGNMTYTGQQIEPTATVKVGNTTLKEGTDYTVSYGENKNVSTGGTVTINPMGNYGFTAVDQSFTIAPKSVTVSGITAEDKTYDGTTTATLDCSKATITGKVDGDTLTVTATGAFAYKDVGVDKQVTITGLTLGGASAGNYQLAAEGKQTTTAANILQATITVTPSAGQNKTYNTTPVADPELTYTYTGAVNNETPAFTGALARSEGENAGGYVINQGTLKLIDGAGFKASNYTLAFSGTEVKFTINKADYGDKTASGSAMYGHSGTVDLSGLVAEGGGLSINAQSTDSDKVLNGMTEIKNKVLSFGFVNDASKAGKTATVVISVRNATNYNDYTITVTLTVENKLTPVLDGALTLSPAEITYGQKLSEITITGTMKAGGQIVEGTFSWKAPDTVLNAGTHSGIAWTFTPQNASTYTEAAGTVAVKVNKAAQSGAVRMADYTYGTAPSAPVVENRTGDLSADVSYYCAKAGSAFTQEWNVSNPPELDAGTYRMYARIAETQNYYMGNAEYCEFTVWKAAPTYAKPTGLTAKYGQTLGTVALTNPEGNTPGTWSWQTPETVLDQLGTLSYDANFQPDDADNYLGVVGASIQVTVGPADGRKLKTVELTQACTDTSEHTYTPDWSELPAGQNWSYNSEYSVSEGSNAKLTKHDFAADGSLLTYAISGGKVGSKITITLKASCANYEDFTLELVVTLAKLSIPAPTAGQNKLNYNGKTQTYLPVIDKAYEAYLEVAGNTAANAGSYSASVSLKDAANTQWEDGTTEPKPYPFEITPAPATVTVLDKKITAGQAAPKLTDADYTVAGLFEGDTLSIRLYYADPSDLDTAVTPNTGRAGTYAIVAAFDGTGGGNYDVTFVPGVLTVISRPSPVGTPAYPVSIPGETENGGVSSDVKNAAKGETVTVTVKPDEGYVLTDLAVTDKDGNELKLTDKGDGKYTFTMPASKVEIRAAFAVATETSPFTDVSAEAYYYEAVKWAASNGITGGIGGGLFGPDQPCTRAQIVTFLWRAAGSPEPKALSSFADVPTDSYYAKAVAWAVENGITVGTSSTTFSPDATCTRAQAVTFLARAAKASASGSAGFRDVADSAYYAEAVKWAVDNGITNGIGGGLFGSDNDCTRGQIVTFLWRLYAGK